MRIRSQLVLAFLLLSVVPLSALVLYGYWSSERAVRSAVEAEARSLTRDMEVRMNEMRGDLRARVARVAALPFARLAGSAPGSLADAAPAEVEVLGLLAGEIGEMASLVEAFEFVPTLPVTPPPPPPPEPPAVDEPTAPPGLAAPRSEATPAVAPVAAVAAVPGVAATPTGSEPPAGVVIRIAPLLLQLRALTRAAASTAKVPEAAAAHAELSAERAALTAELQRLAGQPEMAAARAAIETALAAATGSDTKVPITVDLRRVVKAASDLSTAERQALDADAERARHLFGGALDVPVVEGGAQVGTLEARLHSEEILRRVLGATRREQGEVPFALDRDGELYTAKESDKKALAGLPLGDLAEANGTHRQLMADWTVVTTRDAASGLTYGIARPVGAELVGLKRTAWRNLLFGSGLIALALLGILPLSGRMTRGLTDLGVAAGRIAGGDLTTRVPRQGPQEMAALADSFNRMAEDLSRHQERSLEEERRRKEEELGKRVLAIEVAAKTAELEEARAFQLSLLPKSLPRHPTVEVGVFMRTATEVGGDTYDVVLGSDDALTVAVGDATGHGAKAGTMVTVIKSLLAAAGDRCPPGIFLGDASRAIKRMDLGRMAMALAIARVDPTPPDAVPGRPVGLTLAAAGMPPPLVWRAAAGQVEEVSLPGMPLGSLVQDYDEMRLELAPGDTLLLGSDGFPELLDPAGEPLGYVGARERFAAAASGGRAPREVIASLAAATEEWAGSRGPGDDVTFVVLQARRAVA